MVTALNVEALSGSKRNMFKNRRQGLLIAQLGDVNRPGAVRLCSMSIILSVQSFSPLLTANSLTSCRSK